MLLAILLSALLPVEQLLEERIEKKYNVGLVVAIIEPEGICFYSAGKKSKACDAECVNEKTLFPQASITKVFTTLLIADDVISGRVKLKDPANQYLPPSMQLPKYGETEITLEDLATHTSGIPGFGNLPPKDPYEDFTPERLSSFLSQCKLRTQPGTHYEYCDIIGILGDISAHIAQKPYGKLLHEKILCPLGMNHTKLLPLPMPEDLDVVGYNAADESKSPMKLPVLEATGALYSTAEDMAKFVAANLDLIKTTLYPAMQLSHMPIHSQGKPHKDFDYPGLEQLEIGLGWNIDQEYNVIWKNGNFRGFSSFIGFNPHTKRGVVVLANKGNVIYTDNLALHLLNPRIHLFPLYQEVCISKEILNRYAGIYEMENHQFYELISECNHLKTRNISNGQQSEFFNIYPKSEREFFGKVAHAIFTFEEKEGKMHLLLEEGQKKVDGFRQDN